MHLCYTFVICTLCLISTRGYAAVPNGRALNQAAWTSNQLLFRPNYRQMPFVQSNAPTGMAGVELATQLPQPQGTVLYDPNGLVYVPNSVFPYSGYPLNNAVHEPARIVLVDEPTERTESQNTAKANDDNGKSTSPVTGVVTSTSGTSIIGSPADGVIGSDGQVLGSVQDTAAVESAGNLGPTLLQAQVPMPYLSGPQIYSSGQVAFAPGMRYPQSYVMDKGVTYQVSMDQYGQPLFTQITQDQNQRS